MYSMKVSFKFEGNDPIIILGEHQEVCLSRIDGHSPCTKEYAQSLKTVKNLDAIKRCILLLTQYHYDLETLTLP
jgi:hypothetical protein